MDVVMWRSRDELESHMKVLLKARQRLIEAEAQGHVHLDQPSTEQVAAVDDPMPMVTQQDTEDFYPLDDASFDERSGEEDATMQPAYYPLADSVLCNYEDDVIEEPIHQDVATGRLDVPQYIHVSNSMDFGQDYRHYVSGCVPSAAIIAGTVENQNYNQGSGGAAPSSEPSYNVDSLHGIDPAAVFNDDFDPLDEPSGDEPAGNAVQWERHLYDQVYYDPLGQQIQFWHLRATEDGETSGGYNGDTLLHLELYNDDDEEEVSEDHIRPAILAGRLHVPHIIEDTPVVFNEECHDGNGFGGIPASAAAIAGLKKQKYDGSSGADGSRCVICMRDYKKGKRLLVMPCEYMHRFHSKCLRKWLSRSHLCPLCRHALPTEEQQDVHVSARVQLDGN